MVENTFNVDQSLWGRMSPSDMLQFNTIRAGQGGDAQRNSIAQTLMQQPQQASSGGQVQYSAPGPASVPAGYAPPGDNSDIPAALLGRMSPTDIALFRRAQGGQAIPTGVYGPYGGGAMGQPQIPSGYNAFSGAGLPPTNIGGGGLTDPGAGSGFFGGGLPYNPPPQQTPFQQRFQGAPDPSLTGPSETFDSRFPGGGGSSVVPGGGYPSGAQGDFNRTGSGVDYNSLYNSPGS